MIKFITVYCSASDAIPHVYKHAAQELGSLIAKHGYGLIYGGSRRGLMGYVSEAAFSAGGTVLAVMPELFSAARIGHNEAIELILTDGMRSRKTIMEQRADAFIALPGGLGTLDELMEVMTNKQLGLHRKAICLLNVNGYFDPLLAQIQAGIREGFIQPRFINLAAIATTPRDAIAAIDAYTGTESPDSLIV
ncbi:MAG: TIGR00730 family Rossman fold protein [Herpetosiphon sp.]